MNIKQNIELFIKKKISKKNLKIKISNKTDLFINSVFDSLDYAEFSSYLENQGYYLDIKKNYYKIPRNKIEIFKILKILKQLKNYKKRQNKKKDMAEQLVKKIQSLFKLKKKQNIIIHSNFSNLLKLGVNPKRFLNVLFEYCPEITIFAPAGFFREKKFKLNFFKNVIPSNEFGILTKEILKNLKNNIFRNNNPFDNLVGYNKKGKYFKNKNILAYGKNSPYRKLLKLDTAIMLLDVTFFYNSMFHMVELDARVPYRKLLKFKSNKKIFQLYARKKESLFLDYAKFQKNKKILRLIKKVNFYKIKIMLINYKSLYNESLKILKTNPNFLIKKS